MRRSTRSAIAPANSEQITIGSSSTIPSRPTSAGDFVSVKTWYGMATSAACDPRPEISSPEISLRSGRLSRRTLRSTAIRRFIPQAVKQQVVPGWVHGSSMTRTDTPADPLTELTFEIERFEWTAADRLEVTGRWFGVRGQRFVRPTLHLRVDGRRRRLIALLDHKPWAPDTDDGWTAAFAWRGEQTGVTEARLEVSTDIVLDLPAPGGRRQDRGPVPASPAQARGAAPNDPAPGTRARAATCRDGRAGGAGRREGREVAPRERRAGRAAGRRAAEPPTVEPAPPTAEAASPPPPTEVAPRERRAGRGAGHARRTAHRRARTAHRGGGVARRPRSRAAPSAAPRRGAGPRRRAAVEPAPPTAEAASPPPAKSRRASAAPAAGPAADRRVEPAPPAAVAAAPVAPASAAPVPAPRAPAVPVSSPPAAAEPDAPPPAEPPPASTSTVADAGTVSVPESSTAVDAEREPAAPAVPAHAPSSMTAEIAALALERRLIEERAEREALAHELAEARQRIEALSSHHESAVARAQEIVDLEGRLAVANARADAAQAHVTRLERELGHLRVASYRSGSAAAAHAPATGRSGVGPADEDHGDGGGRRRGDRPADHRDQRGLSDNTVSMVSASEAGLSSR